MMLKPLFFLVAAAALAGCATAPAPEPLITSDAILKAQYAASGAHGALTGDEATAIGNAYLQRIGAASKPVTETETSNQR